MLALADRVVVVVEGVIARRQRAPTAGCDRSDDARPGASDAGDPRALRHRGRRLAGGLLVLAAGLTLAGTTPVAALGALWTGAFGSWYAFTSATLVRAVPLILIGLGIALAFRGGALNIGAEGQFYAGAIAATWVGLHAGGWPGSVALAARVCRRGSRPARCWVALPVVLKRRFGVLEVISTLLLNFVAEALVSRMVQGPLQESKHIYPQSDPIALAARLPLLPGTRLHAGCPRARRAPGRCGALPPDAGGASGSARWAPAPCRRAERPDRRRAG